MISFIICKHCASWHNGRMTKGLLLCETNYYYVTKESLYHLKDFRECKAFEVLLAIIKSYNDTGCIAGLCKTSEKEDRLM